MGRQEGRGDDRIRSKPFRALGIAHRFTDMIAILDAGDANYLFRLPNESMPGGPITIAA
jgi:hypothetical protein